MHIQTILGERASFDIYIPHLLHPTLLAMVSFLAAICHMEGLQPLATSEGKRAKSPEGAPRQVTDCTRSSSGLSHQRAQEDVGREAEAGWAWGTL